MTAAATCPNGHALGTQESRFCTVCGEPARCPQGHPVGRAGLRFCESCGQSLRPAAFPAAGGSRVTPPLLALRGRLMLAGVLLVTAAGLIVSQA